MVCPNCGEVNGWSGNWCCTSENKSLESEANGLGAQLSRLQAVFKSHEYYAGQRFGNVMLDGSLADVDSRLKRLANRVGRLEHDLGVIE